MVPRVELEDENVIDPGRPPAVRVDSDEEHGQEYEKESSVHV